MGKQADARQTLTAMHSHLFACVSEQAAEIASDGYATDVGLRRAKARYDEMAAEYQAVGAALKAIDDNSRIAAERDDLRAEVEDWKQHLAIEVERSAAAESTAAGLRRALEEVDKLAVVHSPQMSGKVSLRMMHSGMNEALHGVKVALSASHDDHERRIKAEALREAARLFMATNKSDLSYYQRDLASRFCKAEADRLEASHG